MRHQLAAAALRGVIFTLVCLLGTFALVAVFAELRFEPQHDYVAEFENIGGLREGNFVRIAGVEVGKVTKIDRNDDNTVAVTFSADDTVFLTDGTLALIRYENLLGGRYLELQEGKGGLRPLSPGQIIPTERTSPPLDLDALIGGFRPLFRSLDPDQINTLSGQLIAVFQGEGGAIRALLDHVGTLTNSLADRDQLIGEVITNLNTVLATLAGQAKQFDTAIDSASQLVSALAERRGDIVNTVAYGNEAAATIADLLTQIRPATQSTVEQLDRTAGLVMADHDYVDNILTGLPQAFRILGRQGIYGDFGTFYACNIILKVNGKGGQPVFVRVAGQTSGRCTPK